MKERNEKMISNTTYNFTVEELKDFYQRYIDEMLWRASSYNKKDKKFYRKKAIKWYKVKNNYVALASAYLDKYFYIRFYPEYFEKNNIFINVANAIENYQLTMNDKVLLPFG